MTMQNNEQVMLDYNAQIEAVDMEFITLDPGTYKFTVTDVAFDKHQPGPNSAGKIPAGTNKVILTLSVDSPQGTAVIKDTFFIHPSTAWRITAVHKCLGIIPEDYKGNFNMNFGAMTGKQGWATTKVESGTSNPDVKFNKVDKYLKPSQAPQQAPTNNASYSGLL